MYLRVILCFFLISYISQRNSVWPIVERVMRSLIIFESIKLNTLWYDKIACYRKTHFFYYTETTVFRSTVSNDKCIVNNVCV